MHRCAGGRLWHQREGEGRADVRLSARPRAGLAPGPWPALEDIVSLGRFSLRHDQEIRP